MGRRSLEDTWRQLESLGISAPRSADGSPLVSSQMPNFDEEQAGVRILHATLENADLGDCKLVRILIGRSKVVRVNLQGADLTGSRMCWSDFEECDFSYAFLAGCDLRASLFQKCNFAGAALRGVDLRRSAFEQCDFSGADLTGAIASDAGGLKLLLTSQQQAAVQWTPFLGEMPAGG